MLYLVSRAPVDEPIDGFLDNKVYAILPADKEDWTDCYTDDESKELYEKANNGEDELRVADGLIYKDQLLYVPKPKRIEIIKYSHGSTIACHPGITATIERICENYWWPKLRNDVTEQM